jgi:hypothetical protein
LVLKTAHAGDFVKIAGDFYHVIKTNPTIADDLLKGGGVEDYNELSNRPLRVPTSEITAGTGTSYRLQLHYLLLHQQEHLQLKRNYLG